MTEAWRVPFARFLKEHAAVDSGKGRHYASWVDRHLASVQPGQGESMTGSISHFIDELARKEEPKRVHQAAEAIRLFSFFKARTQTGQSSSPSAIAGQEWEALVGEMVRLARLKHLSLRTERS